MQMERMDLKLNMWATKHVLIVMSSLLMEATPLVWGKKLPNCSYPAIYSFGDSLTDTGNSIAAFPDQFAKVELDPYGTEWPMHGADRYCDGKVLDDFLGDDDVYSPLHRIRIEIDFLLSKCFVVVIGSVGSCRIFDARPWFCRVDHFY